MTNYKMRLVSLVSSAKWPHHRGKYAEGLGTRAKRGWVPGSRSLLTLRRRHIIDLLATCGLVHDVPRNMSMRNKVYLNTPSYISLFAFDPRKRRDSRRNGNVSLDAGTLSDLNYFSLGASSGPEKNVDFIVPVILRTFSGFREALDWKFAASEISPPFSPFLFMHSSSSSGMYNARNNSVGQFIDHEDK